MSDKLATVSNWVMAAFSVLMAAYVVVQMFAPPPQSLTGALPDAAPSATAVPAANSASAESTSPPAAAAPSATSAPITAAPSIRPAAPRPASAGSAGPGELRGHDDAPRVKGPATPIPALNPGNLPPGMGKDF